MNTECAICFESLGRQETQTLKCNHTFDRSCLSIWFQKNRSCPICRRAVESDASKFPMDISHWTASHREAFQFLIEYSR